MKKNILSTFLKIFSEKKNVGNIGQLKRSLRRIAKQEDFPRNPQKLVHFLQQRLLQRIVVDETYKRIQQHHVDFLQRHFRSHIVDEDRRFRFPLRVLFF